MKICQLSSMEGGWFIGNFSPCAFRTKGFEVGYKVHTKGEIWPTHYHRKITEINLLVRGRLKVQGKILKEGSIFIFDSGEVSDSEFLETCYILVIKTPSILEDKLLYPAKDQNKITKFFISHRGNINQKIIEMENKPSYIEDALRRGFDVEVDVWHKSGHFFLGHGFPQYQSTLHFLSNEKIWCHCKNFEAMEELKNTNAHFFWHQTDSFTITSKGYIWCHKEAQWQKDCVTVLPDSVSSEIPNTLGICSDNIEHYKNMIVK